MIIVLKSDVAATSKEVRKLTAKAARFPGIRTKIHTIRGKSRKVVEIHLHGPTTQVPMEVFESFAVVEKVIRISQKFRSIGRHSEVLEAPSFSYNGVTFSQESLHIFPGLCAVDTRENVKRMFAALQKEGITTTRAGAYKPRTSPYDFQGHGKKCLPYLFSLAVEYGIRVTAMEVTHESHIDEIQNALSKWGRGTGVMLQIGTRNAQNFELLKAVGRQKKLPVLFKRGMGISLEESLNACEYIASEGNRDIVFCLRGMKTTFADPHRNFVDFSLVPSLKRMTRMPIGIDPSHSVGKRLKAPDGLLDIAHVTAQGVVSGANMVLVDFHPRPEKALCDGPQALMLEELPEFIRDVERVRRCYEDRVGNFR
jgi:3-deoxy-7-phosphoheptulonate synthase